MLFQLLRSPWELKTGRKSEWRHLSFFFNVFSKMISKASSMYWCMCKWKHLYHMCHKRCVADMHWMWGICQRYMLSIHYTFLSFTPSFSCFYEDLKDLNMFFVHKLQPSQAPSLSTLIWPSLWSTMGVIIHSLDTKSFNSCLEQKKGKFGVVQLMLIIKVIC